MKILFTALFRVLLFWISFLTPIAVMAADQVGVGVFANDLLSPVNVVGDFIVSATIIVGFGCLFAAYLRYMQHRINPLGVPISTVVVLIILGLVCLVIPFFYKITGGSLPFTSRIIRSN